MSCDASGIDTHSLVNGNFIPYIDYGHSTLFPAVMRVHANRDVMLAISPPVSLLVSPGHRSMVHEANWQRSPTPSYLFSTARQFARVLHRHFSIPLPEVNLPLVSWRMIRGVGGSRKLLFTPLF